MLNNKTISGFSPEVFSAFYAYNWPGNVRELENVVERAVVLCSTGVIEATDLPREVVLGSSTEHTIHIPVREAEVDLSDDMRGMKRIAERRYIEEALLRNHFRVSCTAKELGIHRATLYRKIKDLAIALD